ncbi:fungal-specific transcription factor domain-containing protein [Aspergillus tamarii]|uniref:Fungal-specific transcription factor domain-containing protein n=1 Tax=Aspergillus tamarii TaxID=41984 RepID=A0A5N6UUU3_ASPTM|nr:fungal-specific transcription factor domain-containing protein [Aspergillus tamarii]
MRPSLHKKRRRPALACVMCRRRKVKCDRNMPCGQCRQQKLAACTYASHEFSPQNRHRQPGIQLAPSGESGGREVDPSIHHAVHSVGEAEAVPTGQECATQTQLGDHATDFDLRQPESHSHTGDAVARPPQNNFAYGPAFGTLSKSRIFGHGHWRSAYQLAEDLPGLGPISHASGMTREQSNDGVVLEISDALRKCKELARDIKARRPSRAPLPAGTHQSIPDITVTDLLVRLYFDNLESCYRILHRPSFQVSYESYVTDRNTAPTPFVVQLLLVLSCSAFLLDDSSLREYLRTKAKSWIHIAQCWLSTPIEKDRLSVDGVQVHCLLLLARQINCVGADLVWISVGSLIRMAIQMGLHHDPDRLGEMSPLQKEIRRRLWYTILEMNVQTSLDSGMSPTITSDDFDTQPPSNFNDEDITEQGGFPKDMGFPTRASFQCLLASSLQTRLKAVKVINDSYQETQYDHVLRLADELASACRHATALFDHHRLLDKNLWPTDFAYNFCDHLHRRFILCIHLPYAVKASQNPMFSYSSRSGLEAALDLVSLLEDEMYHRLLVVGGGMFRDIMTCGAIMIFFELITQLAKDESAYARKRNRERREPLLKDAKKMVHYVEQRLRHGETNVRSHVFVSMCMGQVDAMLCNSSVKDAIIRSAVGSLATCHDILQSTAANMHSTISAELDLACWNVCDTMTIPSLDDFDLNFIQDGNMNVVGDQMDDSGIPDSWFLRQWEQRARQ